VRRLIKRIGLVAVVVATLAMLMPTAARADEHYRYANGCSVPSWARTINRDNPTGHVNVHWSCDQHDNCYVFHAAGSSEAGRLACDQMFYRLMRQQVDQQVPWWNPGWRAHGYYWASIYYYAVRAGGSGPFWQNQIGERANVWVYTG
jgi:hypothetical protein